MKELQRSLIILAAGLLVLAAVVVSVSAGREMATSLTAQRVEVDRQIARSIIAVVQKALAAGVPFDRLAGAEGYLERVKQDNTGPVRPSPADWDRRRAASKLYAAATARTAARSDPGTFRAGANRFGVNSPQAWGARPIPACGAGQMIFDEDGYLTENPDVRAAVAAGHFQSGYQHFVAYGARENRLGWPRTGRRCLLFSMSHNAGFFARLGDLCIAHPAFHALRERHPGLPAFWLTRPDLGDLVPAEPPASLLSSDCIVIDGAPPHRDASHWLRSARHPIDFLADVAGVLVAPRHRFVDVAVSEAAIRAVDLLDLPRRFVAVAAGPCYTGGEWPRADRQRVVDRLVAHGVTCVSVGGADAVALQSTLDLCGRLAPSQTVEVINRAQLYVGPDTGTSWLACAARRTPKVCVLNATRLRDGVVGFEGHLVDGNIRDVLAQDGVEACVDACLAALR